MKITKNQLRRIIKEERTKLFSESSDSQYLEALANLTYAADKALESLELASRDIGPPWVSRRSALYEKLDEAMAVMEDLMRLANQAYEKGSEES